MARIRTIKPEFFRHAGLFDAEAETGLPLRVAFAGLWTACDREGRFVWRPRELKLDALPFDSVDFSRVLDALWTRGHISKYEVDDVVYGFIPSWNQHQCVNNKEAKSVLPAPTEFSIVSMGCTREARVKHAKASPLGNLQGERKGKEGKEDARVDDAGNPGTAPPPVASIPLIDGSEFDVTPDQATEWSAAFPAVDVPQKLKAMRAWCLAKPNRRKTRRGVEAFVVNWLGRDQDSGRGGRGNEANQAQGDLMAGAI